MKKVFLIVGVCAVPFIVHAEITITEIAWMGTTNSQYEEWVELYNDGDSDVPVSGWKLFKSGGTTLFTLTGTIPAGNYYVICRTTASLTNPLSGACDEQGAWGGSGLNNTTDQVVLKDAGGATIDTTDGTGGWPAGDASSKQTMQWDGSGWVTGAPTPGAETAGSGDDENPPANDDESSTETKKDAKEKIELVEPDPIYVAHMNIPDYGIAGVAMPIRATVTKDNVLITKRGRFEWSMGDGASYKFFRNTDITHVFKYPGDYTVVMAYYSDVFREEPDSIHRKKITIISPGLAIGGMTDDGGVIIQNDSPRDIDLANWRIVSNGQTFTFPKYTTINKDGELAVSGKTIGFAVSRDVVLRNPNGDIVARYGTANKIAARDSDTADGTVAYAAAPDSDWSANSNPSQASEKTTTIANLWNENKWYILFAILALAAAVAYFVMRLYATKSEIEKSEDLDYDIL